VQDIDYVSSCQPLIACLTTVRTWSQAHPQHLPIYILLETKQDIPKSSVPLTKPEPYTAATFDALDQEIRSVFPPEEIITPDQVRGSYATLNEAIRKHGWPTLAQARGKIIFLMDQRPVGPIYLTSHPSLRGRVLFTNAAPGQPDAAFTEENDGTPEEIAALVREGYLVRTRSDADTKEARTNDTTRRDRALASGAQMVSTDYPPSEPSKWTGYKVSFPDGLMARCNPVLPTSKCVSSELEETK
jgi:Phosphoinositide phospholipase C, Ca2+-dependent